MAPAAALDLGLDRAVMATRVADAVRNDILCGTLRFGQKLKEADLARRFRVSHNVVREAIHILQGEGIVVAHPYRGRHVFELSPSDTLDLLLARTSLEAMTAFLAAERMTPEAEEEIRRRAVNVTPATAATYLEWVEKELAFHRSVWKAASDRWLLDQLNRFTVPFFVAGTAHHLTPGFQMSQVIEQLAACQHEREESTHQWLAAEILSKDPARARAAMIVHLMGESEMEEMRKALFQV